MEEDLSHRPLLLPPGSLRVCPPNVLASWEQVDRGQGDYQLVLPDDFDEVQLLVQLEDRAVVLAPEKQLGETGRD